MYTIPKVLKDLKETRALIDDIIIKLERSEKDANRFYKKGFRSSGDRLRANLKIIIEDLKAQRQDIKRMKYERNVFKDTPLEDDFKNSD